MVNAEKLNEYIKTHRDRFVEEFRQFIAQPSVAADGRGIQPMADLLTERFRKLGAQVQQLIPPEGGSPVVYAELPGAEGADLTLMIYNHYDVQPEVPLELWESAPFDLSIRDGIMYGRGTSDDKGELLSRIQAVEAWQATQGPLPCRIKWVVEGEEEIGSAHFTGWVEKHRDLLSADGLLWEGGGYDALERVEMWQGCKGIAYFELNVHGPKMDLHSSVAPIVVNPAWRLVWALSTLKDENERITIDNYHDHVAQPTAELLAGIDAMPIDAMVKNKERYGLAEWLGGLDDKAAKLKLYTEPTVTICGIQSGYTLQGSKTVLPAHAFAKLDFRMVPNLTTEIVQKLLREHLDKRGFTDIEITLLGGEDPADSPGDSRIRRAAVAASQATWPDREIIVGPRLAGSGPMHALATLLGIPVISAGATWHPNALAHSPNENILERDYFDSMRFTAALLDNFASQ
jgi:acetylornithine deacetylase/succinyl-diaminopimelate desuccinylase-like protein